MLDRAASNTLIGWPILAVIMAGLGVVLLVSLAPMLLAAGVVFGTLFLLVLLERPDLGLLVLLVARACTDLALIYGGEAVGGPRGTVGALLSPNAGLVLTLIVAGGLYVLSRRVPLLALPGGSLFAALILIGLVGMLRSHQLLLVFNEWLPLVASLIVYALVASIFRTPAAIQRVIDVMAVSFILPALFGFYQLVRGQASVPVAEPFLRINGTFVHPNPFGLYLVMILSVFVCQFFSQRGARRLTALLITGASAVLLIATFARFAWAGAMVVFLVVGVLRHRILLAVLPLVAVAAIVISPVASRLEDPFGGSFADRQQIWGTLISGWESESGADESAVVVAVNRLAGLGPGAATDLSLQAYGTLIAPHDDYVRVLIEYGFLGLAAYIALLLTLVRSAYRVWRRRLSPALSSVALSFLSVAIAYPVMSFTDQVLTHTQDQIYFWTLAGLSVVIGRIARGIDGDQSPNGSARSYEASP